MNQILRVRALGAVQRHLFVRAASSVSLTCDNNVQKRNFSFQNKTQNKMLFMNSNFLAKSNSLRIPLDGRQLALGNSFRFMSSQTPFDKATTEAISGNVIDISTNPGSDAVQSALNSVAANQGIQDASISALNIASNYTPIGWCVHYLEFLSDVFPWWGAIAMGTLLLRIAMFPVAVAAQRGSAKMAGLLPEQAILKEKMNQARAVGDSLEFARLAQESHTLFKRHNVNPLKAMLAPMAQIPVFLTLFLTLRRLANYPVESMTHGGLLWFSDLTIPDPLYALPVLTSLTLWATLEMSFRSGMNPNQTPLIKYGARAIPLITLAFTFNFPAAILTYWGTNNLISMVQVYALRQPKVRDFLNIPQIQVNTQKLAVNQKSFKTHFKETMENAKINKMLEERKTIDEINFKKSGIGPLKKTFKENPLKTQY